MYETYLVAALAALQAFVPLAMAQNVEPCKKVADEQTEAMKAVEANGGVTYDEDKKYKVLFDAETAYQCIASVPINKDHAAKILRVHKDFLSFVSTLAFLKEPPESYQQPSIDLMARLDEMVEKVKSGSYKNLYEFDSDLNSINIGVHDTHFGIATAAMGIFTWTLSDSIVSVSTDGKELPQVYAVSDILNNASSASPIVEIEGQSVFKYIQDYVEKKQNTGMLEPHAEWNSVMHSDPISFGTWAQTAESSMNPSPFQSTLFYNGPSLKGKFSNGTEFEWKYMAGTGLDFKDSEIENGQDIYDKLLVKQASNTTNTTSEEEESVQSYKKVQNSKRKDEKSSPKTPGFTLPSYPDDPNVVQQNYSYGGVVSGYLLQDNSIGVFSLPSFSGLEESEETAPNFDKAVTEFIDNARKAGTKKIVVDLSGNTGGFVFLAYDTFRLFFPKKDPVALFRYRATQAINTLGTITTAILGDGNEKYNQTWVTTANESLSSHPEINKNQCVTPDSKQWKSWKDFYGPDRIVDDNFTKPARWDPSNDKVSSLGFTVAGYGDHKLSYDEAFPAEDIILLHDGICGSSCSIFSNLMKNVAGVKSVAVGGIPMHGPMQGVSGTRGSMVKKYSGFGGAIDIVRDEFINHEGEDIESFLSELGLTVEDIKALPNLEDVPWNNIDGPINVQNAISDANLEVPYQFLYESSNCRLFYTMEMIRDVTKLWEAVAKVGGGDTSDCVPKSVDGPGSETNKALTDSPGFSYKDMWSNANVTEDEHSEDSSASTPSVGMMSSLVVAFAVLVLFN